MITGKAQMRDPFLTKMTLDLCFWDIGHYTTLSSTVVTLLRSSECGGSPARNNCKRKSNIFKDSLHN